MTGQITDPRAADVAEVARLLSQASQAGAVPLPALSAAELWVLCGDRQVLQDEAERLWWAGLAPADRRTLSSASTDFLVHRNLLRAAGRDGTIRPMTPGLALIIAARQRPVVVAIGTRADGSAADGPRMFGLAEEGQPPRAVVSEILTTRVNALFGPLHTFSLLSVPRSASALVDWVTEQGTGPRVLDFYRHDGDRKLGRDRLVVRPGRARTHEVRRHRPDGEPEPAARYRADEIAGMLTGLLMAGSLGS